MFSQWKPALLFTVFLTVITGIIYPLLVTGVAQVLFPQQAQGSLVARNGAVVGSDLIGQRFSRPEYFHSRPSAAGSNGYDASASSGSNLGPTNPDLAKRLTKDAAAYRAENHLHGFIPADAITASASGLDPHITPANALAQVDRVATARYTSSDNVRSLVLSVAENRQFGILGEPRLNVLRLNQILDDRFPVKK